MSGEIASQLQLREYLSDAYAIEQQALAQLRTAPRIAGDERLAAAFQAHEAETEHQAERVGERLEAHGQRPSKLKDAVMEVGGAGFILFAQSQPDTPGKLCAHAHAYEALEEAAYELLARVAARANDVETATVARAIRDEERAMRERLAALFDVAVDASLRATEPDDPAAREGAYLADVHALEAQAIALLERAPQITTADDELQQIYREQGDQSRAHQQRIEQRLDAIDGDRSTLKDAALTLGALNWGAFFRAQQDTPVKLAAFVYALEHLLVAAYELLARVAQRAGDPDGAALAGELAEDERAMAARLTTLWDRALDATHGQRLA